MLPPVACCSIDCMLLPMSSSPRLPNCRLRIMPPLPAAMPLFSLPLAAAVSERLSCCGRHTAAAAEMTLGAAALLDLDGGGTSLCQVSAVYVSPVPRRCQTDRLLSCCITANRVASVL